MRTILRSLLVCAVFVSVVAAAEVANAREAGLLTNVTGNVFYGKDKEKAEPFMKAKIDDVFYLEDGATMHIVYFKNGRKEKWTGAVEVTITEEIGNASTENEPAVTTEPGTSTDGLRAIPEFLANLNTEIMGGKISRSHKKAYNSFNDLTDDEKKSVGDTKQVYIDMLKTAAPDDITPELFSIGMLSQHKLYLETLGLVNVALKKQPEHIGLKLVKSSLEKIIKDNEDL